MPEGGGDPDKFVRTFGIKSFRGLERLDLFSWRMKEAVEAGQDCLQVAENAVGLILNEPNILRRRQMAKRLASVTGQPEDSIWAEVERRVDVDKAAAQEQKASIAHKMIREITKNPSRAAQFIAEASSEIELVEKAKHGYDLRSAVGALNMAYERADKNDSRIGLYTGFPIFDDKMRGIPKFDKFISVPGKPNAGKSTWFDNLAWRIAENKDNKDVLVFFHSADDSLYERHSRILGSRFNIPSEMFESPGFYLGDAEACKQRGCENFEEVLGQARQWLKGLFEAERLIVADISEVSPSFPALGKYVSDIRKRFPDKHIVVLEDNFHLLEMPGYTPGEAKIAASSHFIKQLCTREQVTVIATMEITKSDLTSGKRPLFTNLKGSGAIPYDINCNLSVHNDMADLMDEAKIWWDDTEHQTEVQTDGIPALENTRMPILEVISDKNKISGYKGTIFFKMWPMSGRLEECSSSEQSSYRGKVIESKGRAAMLSKTEKRWRVTDATQQANWRFSNARTQIVATPQYALGLSTEHPGRT